MFSRVILIVFCLVTGVCFQLLRNDFYCAKMLQIANQAYQGCVNESMRVDKIHRMSVTSECSVCQRFDDGELWTMNGSCIKKEEKGRER